MRVEKQSQNDTALEAQKARPPQPVGKVVLTSGLVIVGQVLFWFLLSRLFENGTRLTLEWAALGGVLLAVMGFGLMIATTGFAAVMLRNHGIYMGTVVVAALTHFIFFTISLPNSIVILLVVTGFILWRAQVFSDARNRISFSSMAIITAGLAGTVTFCLLAVSVTYYSYLVEDEGSDRLISGVVETAADTVNTVLPKYVEGYDPTMTLDEFLLSSTENIVDADAIGGLGGDVINDAIREGLDAAEGEVLAESRKQFLATFDIQAEGTDSMGDIVTRAAERRIRGVLDPYKKFIPAILALSLFFVLRIFGFVYILIARGCAALVFGLMRATGVVQIQKILVEKEHAEFS